MKSDVIIDRKSANTNQCVKILMTAFQCLATMGYASVSMRNIANEDGADSESIELLLQEQGGTIQ